MNPGLLGLLRLEGAVIKMAQPRIHFERIPLEIVKKIAKEEIQPKKITEPPQGNRKRNEAKDRPRASRRRSQGRA